VTEVAAPDATDAVEPHRRLSLRARVAVLAAAAVAVAVAITSLAIFLTLRAQLYDQLDRELLARGHATVQALSENLGAVLPGDDSRIGTVSTQNGLRASRGGTMPPVSDAEWQVAFGERPQSLRWVYEDGEEWRVSAVPAGPGNALVIASTTRSIDETLGRVRTVALLVGLVGVIVAASAGYGVAKAGLRPLGELTKATERVARTTDLTPIASSGDDEIGRLAGSFNTMLASLAAARERERQLVADAGHELRTPLTSLRTNLDLLRQAGESGRALDPQVRTELLDDVRDELVELGRLVDDLVQLSRGADPSVPMTRTDLATIVDESLTHVRRRAHGVQFDVALSPWWVNADVPSLTRAVTNLLDNAVKWSPDGGTVTVQIHGGLLSIADDGPGIDPKDRPHVFDRFYRSDGARSLPGSGLGLAIVAQAVAEHAGNVTVGESPSGGARFDVAIPGGTTAEALAEATPEHAGRGRSNP
jgi:two-component system sensor histidine kinase MprB